MKHFETWTQGQGLEQVPYTELPETSMGYADSIMDVSGRIPLSWVNQARVLIMAASLHS